MEQFFDQVWQVARSVFDSQELMRTLSRPELLVAAFVTLTAIVFAETGTVLGCVLPGDSLLVTTGLVFHNLITVQGCSGWLLPLLLVVLSVAAIAGDSVGYMFGYRAGPRIFRREQSLLFRKAHLEYAQAFYEKHGGKTIVLARFMPVLRAFAPIVAGAGRMNYRRFVTYNIAGGIAWVFSMVLLGYILTPTLNPLLRPLLGETFRVEKHNEKVIILVVLASIAPGIIAWARHKLFRRKPANATTVV